jgi:PleD family two-component response regulator
VRDRADQSQRGRETIFPQGGHPSGSPKHDTKGKSETYAAAICSLSGSTSVMTPQLIKQAKIFIIDDELVSVQLLEHILNLAGYTNLSMTTDSRRAVSMFMDDDPDLVLLDLHMPDPDGYEILKALRKLEPADTFLPIIVLTGDVTWGARRLALADGATDFLSKPLDDIEVKLRINNVLKTRFLHRQLQNKKALLEERVRERTALLEQTIAELKRAHLPLFSGPQ